ncbi:MAG: protein kinase [Myxococcales bacterium]|nr:protein kinase [Myxococcales bacterium]
MQAATDDEGPTSGPHDQDEPGPAVPAPRPGPVADERTGSVLGNYILQERLGRGGMAAVYRAVHRGFDELVAIKLLAPRFGAQPEMLRRFLREAVVMREISARNHHVVRALDFGETPDGEAYLVMDYLTGQDLQQLLATVGPLPWPRVAPLALQLCDALATTHAHGIIHRDIKPSNCLLTDDAGEQTLKLIDFGIAKDLDAPGERTADNVILGTPSYLAPELLTLTAEPDARSDIYALGATLYCLLTGHPPYVGRGHGEIAHKQRHEQLLAPSAARPAGLPRLPASVDALILRALHQGPDQRFQSVNDLADEIRHTLEPGPATRQLTGAPLGLRTAWVATIVASAAVVLAIGIDPPRPPPRAFASGGAPVSLSDKINFNNKNKPVPPDSSVTTDRPVPADSSPTPATPDPAPAAPSPSPATQPAPSDSPATPGASDSPAGPATPGASNSPAGPAAPGASSASVGTSASSAPTSSAGPSASSAPTSSAGPSAPPSTPPAQTAPSTSSAGPSAPAPSTSSPGPSAPAPSASSAPPPAPPAQPVPSTSSPPPAQPDQPSSSSPPVDPRQQKVRRLLDKQRDTLRRECLNLSGGAKRLKFTLTLSRGAIEAVSAQPATFRECVRTTLRDVAFGVDGQYEYSFSAK